MLAEVLYSVSAFWFCIVRHCSEVMLDMYVRLLINHLSEFAYPAEMARLR